MENQLKIGSCCIFSKVFQNRGTCIWAVFTKQQLLTALLVLGPKFCLHKPMGCKKVGQGERAMICYSLIPM